MAFNGSGTYNLPSGQPVVAGTDISDTTFNTLTSDLATALSQCVTRSGESPATANLPMGGYKHTGTAAASSVTDYARADQVQNNSLCYLTVTGTDTIIGTNSVVSPAAYAAGQAFEFISAGANTTTTVTININSLGAKSITKYGTTTLAIGDIPANAVIRIVYDGTQFQMQSIKMLMADAVGTLAIANGGTNATTAAGAFTNIVAQGGTLTGPINDAQGANIASAATINLTTATGEYVHITGITPITAITLAQGAERTIVFDGALTFTHGASLILPSGANITTAAGDSAKVRGEAAGVVRCVMYTRANGVAVIGETYASAAENIAGTVENKAVDPLGIREAFNATGSAPVYANRAWVNFNGTGTISVKASGNSTMTDNGTGDYTMNITTALPDANYAYYGSGEDTDAVGDVVIGRANGATKTASALRFKTISVAATSTDFPDVCVVITR